MGNCCNNKRIQWSAKRPDSQNEFTPGNPSTGQYSSPANPPVKLKYIGDTQLVLMGTVSKRVYRFYLPKMVLEVDGADARGFMTHPLIIKV